MFSKATKKQTLKSRGTPDFTITLDESDIIIVIECKGSLDDHSMFDNPSDYLNYGYGNPSETERYAINGALWYASFLKSEYDVVVIGVSGQTMCETFLLVCLRFQSDYLCVDIKASQCPFLGRYRHKSRAIF